MSTAAVPKALMTEAEYLVFDRRSDEKHEFYRDIPLVEIYDKVVFPPPKTSD